MPIYLLLIAIIIFICVLLNKVSGKLGIPVLLAFILLGMFFGSDGVVKIPFENYDKNIKFIGAHKDDNIVYFTTGGAVDDEWGIMFVNDGSDSMMEGLGSVARISGNAYEYDTYVN